MSYMLMYLLAFNSFCLSIVTWIFETTEYMLCFLANFQSWAWYAIRPVNSLICFLSCYLEYLLVPVNSMEDFFWFFRSIIMTGNSRITEKSCKVSEENVWSSCQISSSWWGDCLFNVSFCPTPYFTCGRRLKRACM